ncbi:hypothetical protein EVAR_75489_1 [Eumeta japonica]|uniref:Uncharacterized protein n=1 Tax=Eumeta variegata TaxID=151549 RepID=A0A4C1TLH4_EUMVA|nr:hypothetical protein EVAR_75489_1 [Eumeta japonica]
MRNKRQPLLVNRETEEANFVDQVYLLIIHVTTGLSYFSFLVSTIELVFDGANLNLFLLPNGALFTPGFAIGNVTDSEIRIEKWTGNKIKIGSGSESRPRPK